MTAERPRRRLPKLSTCTVTFNPGKGIVPLLKSLDRVRRAARFELEVIIVDNGSVDGTAERIARDWPWVRLVRHRDNRGFATGCNDALEIATGDFLLLLNPDCIVNAKALEGMVRWLRRHRNVGAVGCMLLHRDGLPQRSAHKDLSPTSFLLTNSMLSPVFEKVTKFVYRRRVLRQPRPFRCDWLMGSCIMVPRRVYESVGGLEPSFFMYSEDADWCRRIRESGHAVVHLPQFRIVHLHKQSAARRPEFCFRRLYRSLLHYANRQLAPRERRAVIRSVLLDLYARRPAYRVLSWLRPERRRALEERIESCTRLIEIFRRGDPDLYDDPVPR